MKPIRNTARLALWLTLALATPAFAADIGSPSPEALKGLYPGKAYSPYAQRSFPSQPLCDSNPASLSACLRHLSAK